MEDVVDMCISWNHPISSLYRERTAWLNDTCLVREQFSIVNYIKKCVSVVDNEINYGFNVRKNIVLVKRNKYLSISTFLTMSLYLSESFLI
jgi:hypothetical protein